MSQTRRGCLQRFFGAPTDPINLAVFRIVVFAWLVRLIWRTDFLRFVELPVEFRVPPPGYASFFHLIPLSAGWVNATRLVALIACSAALVGFRTRTAAGISCLGSIYLLGLPEFFGKIDHLHHHLVWFTAILAVAPSGDALSIDALMTSRRRAGRGDTRGPQPSVAYALPLRFVWLLIGVAYFFPGLWKLFAGPEWFLSDSLKYLMYSYWSAKGFVPAFRIDRYPALYRSAAFATIVFETSFIACLFVRRLRVLAVIGGIVFHVMTAVYLRILFLSLLLCYAAFIDWRALIEHLGRWMRGDPAFLLRKLPVRPPGATPAVAGVIVVGTLCLVANVYCGVTRTDSWPFAVFPQFAEIIRSPIERSLELVVRDPSGEVRAAGVSLPAGVVRQLLRRRDPTQRAQLLEAFRDFLSRQHLQLEPGESLQLFEVGKSVVPEDTQQTPSRELLLELRARPDL